MDALILSCGTGGGHNSACSAVEEALTARGHRVRTLNPYVLKSEKTAGAVNSAYNILASRAPSAFGMAYRLGNAYRRLPVSSPVYRLNRHMIPYLERYIAENPCDAVIMTHLFPAEILTAMKRRGLKVPKTFFIATDYVCTPFTEETDCDCYVIPSEELAEEYVRRGVKREKLAPLGIPVLSRFAEQPDREELRRKLALDGDGPHILVAGGSIGAGRLEQIVPLLLRRYGDGRVIAVCGNNAAVYESLNREFGARCTVIGYTPLMPEYMKACDLFISKPGGLSSTEAAVAGAALVHVAPIPGCETRNMEYFARHGLCLPVQSPKRELATACDSLLDGARRREMRRCQKKYIPSDSAEKIALLIERSLTPNARPRPEGRVQTNG